jgi:hypothetical protein
MDVVRGGKAGGAAVRPDAAEYTRRGARCKRASPYDRGMRRARLVVGGLMVVSGAIWMAQGLDLPFAPRSFMTDDRAWLIIGAVTTLAGVLVVGSARRVT